jgi:hypothetical protein
VDITTWNDYLWYLKLFFGWFHDKKIREINVQEVKPEALSKPYEEVLCRPVCSLAIVSSVVPLPSNVLVIVVSGGALSQCPNPAPAMRCL